MHFIRRFNFVISAAIMLVAAFHVGAQTTTELDRPQTFDVQHYTIRASFDRPKKQVFGDTTVSLKPLKAGLRTVELDAIGLSFQSVKLEPVATDLKYKTANGQVVVDLDRP